jgi:hypothetical protein
MTCAGFEEAVRRTARRDRLEDRSRLHVLYGRR